MFTLNELSKDTYEIQDNTITDTWGIVLKPDKLPSDYHNAKTIFISINEQTYEFKVNRFNNKVLSLQVSSVKHSLDDVKNGILKTNNI